MRGEHVQYYICTTHVDCNNLNLNTNIGSLLHTIFCNVCERDTVWHCLLLSNMNCIVLPVNFNANTHYWTDAVYERCFYGYTCWRIIWFRCALLLYFFMVNRVAHEDAKTSDATRTSYIPIMCGEHVRNKERVTCHWISPWLCDTAQRLSLNHTINNHLTGPYFGKTTH